jgi:hypothetical protein
MCLILSDYITPSGFSKLQHWFAYNRFNPSGLLPVGREAEFKNGLVELKKMCNIIPKG